MQAGQIFYHAYLIFIYLPYRTVTPETSGRAHGKTVMEKKL